MELREIARDVYACLQEERGLGTSNSGLVNRAGGLVVDTFWDLPHTRQMIETYARVWRRPARRVVNTHHNGDHCWGNQLFAEAEIIGHRLCAASFGKERPELMQMLRNAGGSEDPMLRDMARQLAAWDFTGVTLTPPTTLIEDRLALDLDGIAVHLIYVGPAHTAGDVIVHLPAARVVFTGDILFRLCTPIGWEGTYERWILQLHATLDPNEVQATIAEIAINLLGAEKFALLFWKTDESGDCQIALSQGLGSDAGLTLGAFLAFNAAFGTFLAAAMVIGDSTQLLLTSAARRRGAAPALPLGRRRPRNTNARRCARRPRRSRRGRPPPPRVRRGYAAQTKSRVSWRPIAVRVSRIS